MGTKLSGLFPIKEVNLTDLTGKIIGIDGHKLIEAGIKPVYVWDGKPPNFKKKTIEVRRAIRREAKKKWIKAIEQGRDAMTYAQSAMNFKPLMVKDSIKLLNYMGIPSIKAPSEGEAQLASMTAEGKIWATASQDWDSLLFNSSRLVRNLSITGRRKLPKKPIYVEIKPELVNLHKILDDLGITREQLIIIGLLVGTDYNSGIKGVGPKNALKIVKKEKTLDSVLSKVNWESDIAAEEILNFFMKPPVEENCHFTWRLPDRDKLVQFMVEEHNFSKKRVEKVNEILKENFEKREKTRSLDAFF
ncbi:MAG: flap endonuclease-1 [Promethearchaeota archaeon]|jgi:flap endonuclease-1